MRIVFCFILGCLPHFLFAQSILPPSQIIVSDSALSHLVAAVKIPTISYQEDSVSNPKAFEDFYNLLVKNFPLVFNHLKCERFPTNSILLKWEGTSSSLKPIMYLAHQDVVPVEDQNIKWIFPPFSAQIDSGYVHGRGTMDDKGSLLGLLEATEYLLKKDFKPNRTIYFAFGSDEEIGGTGAKEMAEWLLKKNIQFEYILDEGGAIGINLIQGIDKPIALVGIAEKGYVSIQLEVNEEGGHSSMPPEHTAIGILSTAITKLEAQPFPAKYDGATKGLFDCLAPEMSFSKRFVFKNSWMFSSLIMRKLAKTNATNATIRTTTAVTVFKAGEKDNVLPNQAKAIVNFRTIPGETMDDVMKKVKYIINDKRIKRNFIGNQYNASPISDVNSVGYKLISKTVNGIFPTAIVAPYLILGITDSRHYSKLCNNIFRFVPLTVTNNDLKRMHGINERIAIEDYYRLIEFYATMIENSNNY